MRRLSEFSGSLRAFVRGSGSASVFFNVVQGGGNQKVPNALAVLAANEARIMFWLVKLSECRTGLPQGAEHEPVTQARSAALPGEPY